MAVSVVSICNMALAALGEAAKIASPSDTSTEAKRCRLYYEPARDAVLREHPWNFAQARAQLQQLSETVSFGFDNVFLKPSDCLRIIGIYGEDGSEVTDPGTWKDEGGRILSDEDTLYILYTRRVKDPQYFDPLFVEALHLRLAAKVAQATKAPANVRSELWSLYKIALAEAQSVDSTEGPDEEEFSSAWENSRY